MYQLLQLSPLVLKKKIKEAELHSQKRKYLIAMVIRSILLILFAIAYISLFTTIFGNENSSVAVGSFCILLGIRFVPYGYHIAESIAAMGGVFGLMFVGGLVTKYCNPFVGLLVNFSFVLLIMMVTADEPIMGNAGIYIFSYLFTVENPVTIHQLPARAAALALAFFVCGLVFFRKHKEKNRTVHLKTIFQNFAFHSEKSLWQLRMAVGISIVLFIGHSFNISRTVWMGYACMSVLLPMTTSLRQRASFRVLGVVVGSLLFGVITQLIPTTSYSIMGPLAGLCIGFSGTYFWNTVLNCFGGLLLASTLYGISPAILFRIENNLLGAMCAIACVLVFSKLANSQKYQTD